MLPIILSEDDNGEIQMEMDTKHVHVSNDNESIEIVMDNESAEENYHSIYDGWTRMTPQEISHWIDKYGRKFYIFTIFINLNFFRRSRTFFPGAFLVFNIIYWTFVCLF